MRFSLVVQPFPVSYKHQEASTFIYNTFATSTKELLQLAFDRKACFEVALIVVFEWLSSIVFLP